MDNRRTLLKTLATAAGGGVLLATLGDSVPDAQAAGKGKETAGPTSSGYFGQMQVTANMVRSSRNVGIMQLDAGMYSRIPGAQERANSLAPSMRAQWRATLQEFINRYHTPGRVPDAALLATQLQAATNQVMGNRSVQVIMVALVAR
jgi:hypothetical protein